MIRADKGSKDVTGRKDWINTLSKTWTSKSKVYEKEGEIYPARKTMNTECFSIKREGPKDHSTRGYMNDQINCSKD